MVAMAKTLLAAVVLIAASANAHAQDLNFPSPAEEPPHQFSLSVGSAYVQNLTSTNDRGYAASCDLEYAFNDRWGLGVGFGFDREYSSTEEGLSAPGDALSLTVGVNRSLPHGWSVDAGFYKGLAENEHNQWYASPDIGIGVGLTYTMPISKKWDFSIGPSVDYSFHTREFSLSVNVAFTFSL